MADPFPVANISDLLGGDAPAVYEYTRNWRNLADGIGSAMLLANQRQRHLREVAPNWPAPSPSTLPQRGPELRNVETRDVSSNVRPMAYDALTALGASHPTAQYYSERAGQVAPWSPLGIADLAAESAVQLSDGNYGRAALNALAPFGLAKVAGTAGRALLPPLSRADIAAAKELMPGGPAIRREAPQGPGMTTPDHHAIDYMHTPRPDNIDIPGQSAPGMTLPGERNIWDMGPTGHFAYTDKEALRRDVQMKLDAMKRPANALNRYRVNPTDYE